MNRWQQEYNNDSDIASYLMNLAINEPEKFTVTTSGIIQYRLMYEAMKTMQTALINQLMVIDKTIGNTTKTKDDDA